MKTYTTVAVLFSLLLCPVVSTGIAAGMAAISGTWTFSVDLEDGRHGAPMFVFEQQGEKLTGSYTGPLGEYDVTGTVKGDQAVFGFQIDAGDQNVTATFSGKIDGDSRMTGNVDFSNGVRGKWVATKR